jgi:DNA-binding NarL/FixJ family response regulator
MESPSSLASDEIRVLLIENTELVRRGLRDALATARDIRMVADASMGQGLTQMWPGLVPDVAVVSLARGIPGETDATLAAVRSITDGSPGARIILLLDDDAPIALIMNAICAGALGLLTRSVSAEVLRAAVRDVAAGHATVCAPLSGRLFDQIANQPPLLQNGPFTPSGDPAGTGTLTRREVDVLDCIAHGLSNSEAAQKLGLTSATIKTHLRTICGKLGVANRTSAALVGLSGALLGANRRPPGGFLSAHEKEQAPREVA